MENVTELNKLIESLTLGELSGLISSLHTREYRLKQMAAKAFEALEQPQILIS